MIPLILFVALGVLILVLFEWRARHQTEEEIQETLRDIQRHQKENIDGECCGQHLVCEKETLLQTNAQVEYYDDEELDSLAGIRRETYSSEQAESIRDVFHSLQEKDVIGWVRSMQLRNIDLPLDVREEALLIVQERRKSR